MQQKTNTICQLPLRPQRRANLDKDFRIKTVESNHFELQFLKDVILHIYSFAIQPEPPLDSEKEIRKQFNEFKDEIQKEGIKRYCITGMNLWSYELRKNAIHLEKVMNKEKKMILDIKYVKTINLKEMAQFDDQSSINVTKQAINAILKQLYESRNMKELFGKGKFYESKMNEEKNLQKNYNIGYMKGFRSAFCSGQSSPLLQIDYSVKLINTYPISRIISDMEWNYDKHELQLQIRKKLIGQSGLAKYSNRFYRIDDIDFSRNPQSMMEDGKTTYRLYYQQRYNITINDISQPLLVHQTKKGQKIRLIPELMMLTGLSQAQKTNTNIKKFLRPILIVNQNERQQRIMDERGELEYLMKQQNIVLKSNSKTQAYEIRKPEIYAEGIINSFPGGCFEIKNKFYQQSKLENWVLIYNDQEEQLANYFLRQLISSGNRYGLILSQPLRQKVKSDQSQDWISCLEQNFSEKGRPKLVVSLIDQEKDKQIYQQLKQYLIAEEGVSHQNVTLQLIENQKFGAIVPKIIQQIHSKLGNQTWNIQKIQEISDNIMIVGIDVYHKTVLGLDSCVGFNAQFGQQGYANFTKTIIVRKGKEINKDVAMLLEQSLEEYQNYNKKLPDTIIIFRDGVGTSQINRLYQEEVETMKEIINNKYNLKLPEFAFIMVNKRINDRFFSQSKENFGMIVADRVVSSHFDYFLIAQQVNQGTATPTHYTVLENSTKWNEDLFWKFTFYQCFNYRNWCGPVKIPACVQNAHTAAYRVGEVIKTNASYYLETKLFFL
ncbi:unnamed protein product (macronuclear) [Paramecium tetraurelia]|uniref:Chromosome undetermined scaffold_179, whole genome shotgun sequence n=1 Tax=Paramecium tetraurelia TaxID=5888 RepID=Q3SD95_PARTE|nr:uncharacterized protein GSPATT00038263001 [Paramecium tetraurelia]CAI44468.1 PAZ and PIWI domain protein [Paramecium tetraurelia]CAK69818.1 unnamed protein product [Paramecium tetraurelia]|eukprot:XP_001437215.1 hypothetical protein (macronuclear) [Paramecium tetraurelia strain d4-2]